MRRLLIVFWLLLPLPVLAYHFGPGQQLVELDRVAATLEEAQQAVDQENWSEAVQLYDRALQQIPEKQLTQAQRIRLEKAKAQMMAKQLPKAHADLKDLVKELEEDTTTDPTFLDEARSTLANSQYYMTWLMRLEGVSREEWEPEIEAARQTYHLIVQRAQASGNQELMTRSQEDLEASVRLARMDLKDLQGLPLPSQ